MDSNIDISVLFFSEKFAIAYGIGYFIMSAWVMANYVDMFRGILTLSLFGLLLFSLIDRLERWICRWYKPL